MYLGRNEPGRILESTQLFEWNVLFPDISLAVFSGLLQVSAQISPYQ